MNDVLLPVPPAVSAAKSKAAKSGSKGEAVVAKYNDHAKATDVATLHKIPTDTRVFYKHGKPVVFRPKKSTVDFLGYRHSDGVHIAVEVKRCTTKTRFNLGEIEPHQRDYLEGVRRANGVAFVAIVWGKDNKVCLFDWTDLREYPGPSLSGADLEAAAVTAERYAACLNIGCPRHIPGRKAN